MSIFAASHQDPLLGQDHHMRLGTFAGCNSTTNRIQRALARCRGAAVTLQAGLFARLHTRTSYSQ